MASENMTLMIFVKGLYGLVRPYDDVKPVRDIPMNAKIQTKKGL